MSEGSYNSNPGEKEDGKDDSDTERRKPKRNPAVSGERTDANERQSSPNSLQG